MKNKILAILLAMMTLASCSGNTSETGNDATDTSEPTAVLTETSEADMSEYETLSSSEGFATLTVDQLASIIGDGETDAVIYMGSPSCSHCIEAVPVIQQAAINAGENAYYINISMLTEDEFDSLLEVLEPILEKDANGNATVYTPHVFAVVDGEISSERSLIGYTEGTTDYNALFATLNVEADAE